MIKYQGIYKIKNLSNGKVYIGQSIDIKNRFYHHRRNVTKNKKHPLYNAINKYGIVNFEFNVIEHVYDSNKLDEREQYWLDYYNSYNKGFGYNLLLKAESWRGYKHTEETIRKIAESHKGKPSPMKGKKHREESNKKNSESQKGKKRKPHTEESRKKMALSKKGNTYWLGKKHTNESKLKIAESQKNKVISEETRLKISESNKGKKRKPFTEDTRNKMSESAKIRLEP